MIRISAISDDMVTIEGHPDGEDIDCDGNRVEVVVFSVTTGHAVVVGMTYDEDDEKWTVDLHPPGHRLLPCTVFGAPPTVEVDIDADEASIAWQLYGVEDEDEDEDEDE